MGGFVLTIMVLWLGAARAQALGGDDLVALALARPGVAQQRVGAPFVGWLATWRPRLWVEARHTRYGALRVAEVTGSARERRGSVRASVWLDLRPSRRATGRGSRDLAGDPTRLDLSLFSARTARLGAAYRAEVAATVADLASQRARMDTRAAPSLASRVERALRRAEVDALLDAYTDGAISRRVAGGAW